MGEERIIPPPPGDRRRENEILTEIPTTLGLVLWQDARHLRAWAESSEEVRAHIFNPRPPAYVTSKRKEAQAQGTEIAASLEQFGALKSAPLAVDVASLAAACVRVVDWALAYEYSETAIEFAEVAAIIDPEDPSLANLAGRMTRNAGDYARAEIWFKRGIGYSREQGKRRRVELTRAHLGYGILCQDLGRVSCAMRHFNSGSRLARRVGLEWLAAEVQHDLMLLLTVRGRQPEAERHAHLALKWYGKRHERFPLFAADVALLMVLERNYPLAARFSKGALRHVLQPAARSVILALHARALAGIGLVEDLGRLRRRVLRILEDYHEREAAALWHIAAAERLAGKWKDAEATGTRAFEIAQARGDRETAHLTKRLLTTIRARKPAPPPGPTRRERDFLDFVQTLSDRLSTWSPEKRNHSKLRADWAA